MDFEQLTLQLRYWILILESREAMNASRVPGGETNQRLLQKFLGEVVLPGIEGLALIQEEK
tara:strand:- start:223 stop:405 length:183 start_codon:yes stop_codon:yes gene_type:complete